MCTIIYDNTRRKANRYTAKNGMRCISQTIFRRLIQWWWTTRQDIIRIGHRGIVLRGQIAFLLLFAVAEKHGLDMYGYYVWGWPWRRVCSVCEFARALVIHSQLMNYSYVPSQLGICENKVTTHYVASYRANKKLVVLQMFSCKLRQWRWFTTVFFHRQFPIYSIAQKLGNMVVAIGNHMQGLLRSRIT